MWRGLNVQKSLSFWTAAFACRALTMPMRRSNSGRERHKYPHYPDIRHRHGYEHEAA